MTFLDCPAYLDEDGARRCGLPAEVRCRFVLRCSDGPLEAAMIRCPSGHWFNGPIESLAWESQDTHHPGKAEVKSSATDRFQEGPGGGSPVRPTANSPTARAGVIARVTRLDGRGGTIVRDHPEKPRRVMARPNTAPAYYLGRPARIWMTAMNPRRRRKPAAGAQSPQGKEQTLNPAHEPSQALAYRTPLPLGGDLSNSGIG